MIRFRKERILEIRISIKEELQLKTFWVVNSTPLDIFEVLESPFIMLLDLPEETVNNNSTIDSIDG